MLKKLIKFLLHIVIMVVLTVFTQIGGLVWMVGYVIIGFIRPESSRLLKLASVLTLYLAVSLLLVPYLATISNRVPLPWGPSQALKPRHWSTVLLNRHYVHPDLKSHLLESARQMQATNSGIGIRYLDANFPFFEGFPLLPHLSHDDGLKVDLSFLYNYQGEISNNGPSRSGYGVFEGPSGSEPNQILLCKNQGYWQYDFTKYLVFGKRQGYSLDEQATRQLIETLLVHPQAQMLFIEPHLKQRLRLSHTLVRYHGCQAVRHDDHIHFQMRPKRH